jgi:hypothetical protein
MSFATLCLTQVHVFGTKQGHLAVRIQIRLRTKHKPAKEPAEAPKANLAGSLMFASAMPLFP